MNESLIIYGALAYFIGLIISAGFALAKRVEKAGQLFSLVNFFGFVIGASYLINFSPEQIVIGRFNWLFHFNPSLTFLSAIFFTLISIVCALVGIFSIRYLELYKETYDQNSTYFLMIIFTLGMQGVFFANNAFSFLFFWEIMSIASFFLVMADGAKESFKAAFLYFVMTHLGASAILAGFLILGNGSLIFDFSNIGVASQNLSPAMVSLSFVLFFFGFGSKAGLLPFHVWLPEAHPQAPSNISALMSGLMLKAAIFGFISIVFSFTNIPTWAGLIVIVLGLLSGLIGALNAAVERDIKRAFAYSSIENMGIIFTMLGLALHLASQNNPTLSIFVVSIIAFAILHAISHAFFKTALFLSSGVIISRVHSKSMEIMGGLAKLMPVFSFIFLIAILSSLPIAPFSTFYGEWGFIQSIISLLHAQAGVNTMIIVLAALVFIGLIGGLAVFAMIKIFGISMLGLSRTHHLEKREEKADILLIAPIGILVFCVIALGFFSGPFLAWMKNSLLLTPTDFSTVSGQISSIVVFVSLFVFVLIAYGFRKIFTPEKLERIYHTWDCGQAINSTMEYTATAFSAPIRFFFLPLLRRENMLKSEPVAATNLWIRKYSFTLSLKSVWKDNVYRPLAAALTFFANRIKVIQGGRIQYYLLLFLVTLIVTLIFAL